MHTAPKRTADKITQSHLQSSTYKNRIREQKIDEKTTLLFKFESSMRMKEPTRWSAVEVNATHARSNRCNTERRIHLFHRFFFLFRFFLFVRPLLVESTMPRDSQQNRIHKCNAFLFSLIVYSFFYFFFIVAIASGILKILRCFFFLVVFTFFCWLVNTDFSFCWARVCLNASVLWLYMRRMALIAADTKAS